MLHRRRRRPSLGRLVGRVGLLRLRGARARGVQLLLEVVELRRVRGVRRGRHGEALALEAGARPAHGRRQRLRRAHAHAAGPHAALHAAEAGPAHGVGPRAAEGVGHLGRRVEAGGVVVRHAQHPGRAHDAAHAGLQLHAARAREVRHAALAALHLHLRVGDALQEVQAGRTARARVARHLWPRGQVLYRVGRARFHLHVGTVEGWHLAGAAHPRSHHSRVGSHRSHRPAHRSSTHFRTKIHIWWKVAAAHHAFHRSSHSWAAHVVHMAS